ncbi:MAG: ATP-binding protein [Verrucomicrobiales bacterium]|nr:ATP-binding protein [Verrucomicrobiales bacterium]
MEIRTEDFETLGQFYLGREYDLGEKEMQDNLVLYDSKDLVTHGVVLGMTGSGKTGLCIAILEEAALDNIPAIVIDPKGDIANLMLTFPDLAPEDFRPWINEDDAKKKGITPDEHAAKQAALWEKGIGQWGQGKERIKSFRDKVDLTVYTPGSNAGLPVSILSSLDVPEFEILDDAEMLGERIESTVSSLLSLVGVDADPIQDPEHILLSNIFAHSWKEGYGVTLESLITQIQQPPFDKIGVMDLDTVCPEKDRRELAMKMNNLLASPGFSSWLQGEPLDMKRMMYTEEGKPRISIFSIAHLSDSERMFFVSLLLNQTLGWMRSQSGTTSLRAMLYMDEIYGYLPPTANPPSKKPMMTMLKQARAFGLGILLATQNPVDLDYKALSNIGTWWLGRLQTERDKARVLDGLEGAAADNDAGFDRGKMEELLAGLGSRVFLMNNVHEDGPVVFHVRWVLSYLRGPLARRQIKKLMDPKRKKLEAKQAAAPTPSAEAPKPKAPVAMRPRLPKGADEFFFPAGAGVPGEEINYQPAVMRVGEVRYSDPKKGINGVETVCIVNKIDPESEDVDWSQDLELPNGIGYSQLSREPVPGATFGDLPQKMLESDLWSDLKKELVDFLYGNHSITVYRSPLTDQYSNIGETEGDFRGRLVHAAREVRDEKVEELREEYEKKIKKVEDRVERALDVVEEQKAQSNRAKMDTAMRVGGTLLGAILGRKVSSSKGSSVLTGTSRAWKESRDVARAEEEVEELAEELEELDRECGEAVAKLKEAMDPMTEKLEEIRLTPLKKNCDDKAVGVVWMPYRVNPQPVLGAAW